MKMLSKQWLLVAGLFLAFSAQADTKIGYINREMIMSKAAPFARAQGRLDKEFGKRKTDLIAMQKKLADMKAALEKGDVTMSESDRRQKERDFNSLSGEFQRKSREFSEDLAQRQGEELKAIEEKTMQVIRQIGQDGKYDLIVQDALYYSSAVDITPLVIKALADK